MTREQAKNNLISFGVENPTEEQITNYLNQVNGETQKEKDRADKLKEKADKADELQTQLDTLQSQNLSEAEMAQKENEKLQQKIAELQANSFKAEAKAILKGAKLEDADIEALLPGMVAGLEKVEDVQARASAYVAATNKVRENAIKEHDKDVLDGTGTPGAAGGAGNETKTEDVEFAEQVAASFGTANKESESAFKNY